MTKVKLERVQEKVYFRCAETGCLLKKAHFYPKVKKSDPDVVFRSPSVAVTYYQKQLAAGKIKKDDFDAFLKELNNFLGLKKTDVIVAAPDVDPACPDFSYEKDPKYALSVAPLKPPTSAEEYDNQQKENKESKKGSPKLPSLGFVYVIKPEDEDFPVHYTPEAVSKAKYPESFSLSQTLLGHFGKDDAKPKEVTVHYNKDGKENPVLKRIFPGSDFKGTCAIVSKKQLHKKEKKKSVDSSPETDCCLSPNKKRKVSA